MILKSDIHHVASKQFETIRERDSGIQRIYSDSGLIPKSHALIISGIRRCGKTTLMHQMLKEADGGIFFLNLDDPRLFGFELDDFQRAFELIEENHVKSLFFDEIQVVHRWELFIRQLTDLEKYSIVLSGSNASMLSRELGTHLTGRHIGRELFPFSYEEFLSFKGVEGNADHTMSYMEHGGFPAYLKSKYPEVLMEVLNDIIYRDISVRLGVRNQQAIRLLASYMVSNVSKLFTANSLRKVLPVASTSTMMEYLAHFEDTYLVFYLPKYSSSYKKQIQNPRKLYAIDTGLANVNSSSLSSDFGRLFENMVFLALRRRFSDIYYHADRGECDFLVRDHQENIHVVQACFELNSGNLDREILGLREAMRLTGLAEGRIVSCSQEDEFRVDEGLVRLIPFHKWINELNSLPSE